VCEIGDQRVISNCNIVGQETGDDVIDDNTLTAEMVISGFLSL